MSGTSHLTNTKINESRQQSPVPTILVFAWAVAILLGEMCGLQSVICLLLYSSHVDKQVSITITCIYVHTLGVLAFESCWGVYELHSHFEPS